MATQFAGMQQNINILMNDPNYKVLSAFSNHMWAGDSPSTAASLEDVHNSVHTAVGGNMGHMSELDYSSFDPVFWLHHWYASHCSIQFQATPSLDWQSIC
jgi:tyrosinase